jgi:DNA/RNA endonuclease YhcR with UshA esterase domain
MFHRFPFREADSQFSCPPIIGLRSAPTIDTEDEYVIVSAIMRFFVLSALFVSFLSFSGICVASNPPKSGCVPFAEAAKHVGTTDCVTGTVLHIENGSKGVTFLSFCKDAKACPFSVVVFPNDIKKMGDIRQLEGKQIEIKGTIQDYDGRAEIVLRRTQQLGSGAFLVFPPVPTDYDVEHQGHNSAGKFVRPKVKKTTTKEGDPVSIEDPGEPQ